MKATIKKSAIKGTLTVPSSKSMTIRALICAALSAGETQIVHPLVSDDTNSAINVLTKIGTVIHKEGDIWKITGGKFRLFKEDLDCGESATTLRLMTAISSLIPGSHRLVGGPSLSRRPIGSLVDALSKLGVKITTEKLGLPPVNVEGGTFRGGPTEIPGNVSSQFISALLMVSPFAPKGVSIKLTTPLTSRPYILMTLWCLKQFGINVLREGNKFIVLRQRYVPTTIKIESDWSSASYFLAMGAMSKDGIQIPNLNMASLQGDRILLDLLRDMGAKVTVVGSNVTVKFERLKGIHADLSDCIDLLPTMASLAAVAKGTTELIGIQRARIKESNRVTAVRECLTKLGVIVVEEENRLRIIGRDNFSEFTDDDVEEEGEKVYGLEREPGIVTLNSRGDHRIAMGFAIMGAALGDVIIDGAECVSKTYPNFWEDFKKVGGDVTLNE